MKFVIVVLRGALGGVVGGFVWVLLFVLLASQPIGGNVFQVLAVTYILSGLPFGLFVGAIIGLIIWIIRKRKAVTLTLIDRLILGMVIAALVRSISLALQNNVGYVPGSWYSVVLDIVLFALVIGGVSGIFVGDSSRAVLNNEFRAQNEFPA